MDDQFTNDFYASPFVNVKTLPTICNFCTTYVLRGIQCMHLVFENVEATILARHDWHMSFHADRMIFAFYLVGFRKRLN